MSARTKVACDNCRNRKKKCDGLFPCSTCSMYKSKLKNLPMCAYSGGEPIKDPNQALKSRIENLEHQLCELSHNPKLPNSTHGELIPNILTPFHVPGQQGQQTVSGHYATSTSDSSSFSNISERTNSVSSWSSYSSSYQYELQNPGNYHEQSHIKYTMATTFDPYFSWLPKFGDIYNIIGDTELIEFKGYRVACRRIHQLFLDGSDMFSIGRLDDGYKILFFAYQLTNKYQLFENVYFQFPSNYPVIPMQRFQYLPSPMQDDVASIETLRGTMLKIDTFTAYLTNRNFIVHEKDFEVDLLPTILEVPRIPKFESFPKEFQRQWLLMEDLTPLSQFYYSYHVNAIRMMRRLVYFSRLNQHNYSTSELSAIIMNFHNYLMEFYAKIPIKYLPYNSMEDFEQGSESPTLKDNASELLFRLTPLKLHICMFATLHSTAISHGLNLSYSVSYGSSKLYKSSDILLLSIRTFKFLISRNPCGDVQFVHSLQYGVPAWLSYEVSAAVKKGLEAYGDPAYLREAVEIIGNSIHPDVSVVGWMWPIASHSACKMHKLLRQ